PPPLCITQDGPARVPWPKGAPVRVVDHGAREAQRRLGVIGQRREYRAASVGPAHRGDPRSVYAGLRSEPRARRNEILRGAVVGDRLPAALHAPAAEVVTDDNEVPPGTT